MRKTLPVMALLCGVCVFASAQQEDQGAKLLSSLQSGSFDTAPKEDAAPVELPDAPKPKTKPEHTEAEKAVFWSTFVGYHATFAADAVTTGIIQGKPGGYETDPLYTRFGNRNAAGVVGSMAAVHAGASVGSLWLYDKAAKEHGKKRVLMEGAAIAINSFGIAEHTYGAAHNSSLLTRWNSK